MQAKTRVKIKGLLIDLGFDVIVLTPIVTFSIWYERFLEFIIFFLSWNFTRYAVPHIWHYKSNKPIKSIVGCGVLSVGLFICVLKNIAPVGVSLFAGVVISIFINMIFDKLAEARKLLEERETQKDYVYSLAEEDLRNYGASKGLTEAMVDTLVLKVIHNYKWKEIAEERRYSKSAIKYHKKQIETKLNIKF